MNNYIEFNINALNIKIIAKQIKLAKTDERLEELKKEWKS